MVGIPATATGIGGWTVGPVVGRRPAGTARDAVHPGTGARAVLIVVDGRFTGRGLPDAETVARAAAVGSPAVMPMLDAGLLEDGTRWYVTPASPGPVLDPAAGCSPRRAATIVESVARGLAAVHAAGLVHGLVGPNAVIPAAGRHAGRPVGTTLLLDAGVAALLGDRADDLAVASGVSLPVDRGPAADVYALGALLLRLVTAAAPAGPALAALPVPLRDLLSAMLDEHPSRRPTADAVASRLAAMREGLLATGPVELPRSAPVAVQRTDSPAPQPAPAPRPVASAPVSRPVPQVVAVPDPIPSSLAELATGREVAPRTAVPAPVRAPHTVESPFVVPRSAPAPAPSLWTGPVPIADPSRPGRGRAKRILLLAGGVGLAGLLIGVVTHLPLGHVDGDQAVAAVAAENGGLSVAAATSAASGSSISASTASTASKRAKHLAVPASSVIAAPAPAFARPTRVVPSPLASSATSTTPSRNTTTPVTSTGSSSSAPTSTTPSSASSAPVVTSDPVASRPSTPTATQTSSDTPTASTSSAPESSAPTDTTSSTPSSDPTTSDPTPSDTDSTATDSPSDAPSGDPSPSGS